MKTFKFTKLQKWYNEYAYTLHLESTIVNVLPYLLPLTLSSHLVFLLDHLRVLKEEWRQPIVITQGRECAWARCMMWRKVRWWACGKPYCLFSCERGIKSMREELLDAHVNQWPLIWVKTLLDSTQTFRGYKAIKRFNTVHSRMCCLLRILPAVPCIFPTSGVALVNYSLAICSSHVYFHDFNNVLDSCF